MRLSTANKRILNKMDRIGGIIESCIDLFDQVEECEQSIEALDSVRDVNVILFNTISTLERIQTNPTP